MSDRITSCLEHNHYHPIISYNGTIKKHTLPEMHTRPSYT